MVYIVDSRLRGNDRAREGQSLANGTNTQDLVVFNLTLRLCTAFCRLARLVAFCVHPFRAFCGIPIQSILAVKLRIFQRQIVAAVSAFAAQNYYPTLKTS
jgi:hypothetical protein